MWGVRVLTVVLVMVSAGCTSAEEKPVTTVRSTRASATLKNAGTPTRVTTVPQAAPAVVIRKVVQTSPEVRLKDRTGEELALGPVVMKMERFNHAYVMPAVNGTGHVIYLELPSDLANQFAELTIANVGKRLALVAGDTVIFAPEITGGIVDGRVEISGNYTKSDAEAILTSITGK